MMMYFVHCWADHASIQACLDDPEFADLHPLREGGTLNYLWWAFDKLDDLRPLLKSRKAHPEMGPSEVPGPWSN